MSNPKTNPNWTANGNVSPCRFVTPVQSASGGGLAVQASAATQLLVGVSGELTRYPPNSPADDGYMAIAGEPLTVRGPLEIANLDLGGTVTNTNSLLTSDGSGKGIVVDMTVDTLVYHGALALQAGVSGDRIMVWVLPPAYQLTVHL